MENWCLPKLGAIVAGNVEMQVDDWSITGESDKDIEGLFNSSSSVKQILDNRHLHLRTDENIIMLKVKPVVLKHMRLWFECKGFSETIPPIIVQTQCEGTNTLFPLKTFSETSYLSQSCQLYLETMVPCLHKNIVLFQPFRAEKSRTRRHLCEYTHSEAEAIMSYDELLDLLEDDLADVKSIMSEAGELVRRLNPDFKKPERPFLRMSYDEAIKYCQENKIYRDDNDVAKSSLVALEANK